MKLVCLCVVVCLCAYASALAAETAASGESCYIADDVIEQNGAQRYDKTVFEMLQGKKILSLSITVNNIFNEDNPDEDTFLYRLANRLQVNTRENTIRKQLLFKQGDAIDLDLLDESLRRLYQKEYLLAVQLRPTQICADGVHLNLVVRDAWTIEPRISAGQSGGETSSQIGLRDGNFLGSGAELELVYKSNQERSQVDYKYRAENFLHTRWLAEFYHADLSDGENNRVIIERPFFSNNTRWAYGFKVEDLTQVDKIRHNNEVINAFGHRVSRDEVYIGNAFSTNNQRTYRIRIGSTELMREFKEVELTEHLPDAELHQYNWIGIERQSNVYKQYNNLNFIARTEDIAMGHGFRLRYGSGLWGNGDQLKRLIGSYNKAVALDDFHFLQFGTHIDITYNSDTQSTANSTWGLSSSYHHFIDRKNRWQVDARWDKGNDLAQYRELTLGEESGMRGYPLSFQRGDNRYLMNIERRYYSDLHWFNLIRVGAVAFMDIGRAWDSATQSEAKLLASTGIGLRFQTSKTGNPAVIQVNLSKPLVATEGIDSYLLSVAVGARF